MDVRRAYERIAQLQCEKHGRLAVHGEMDGLRRRMTVEKMANAQGSRPFTRSGRAMLDHEFVSVQDHPARADIFDELPPFWDVAPMEVLIAD